mgnify:CR=1 FL=1
MVDLHRQYLRLKSEIDAAMQDVVESTAFINGPQVGVFASHLADYMHIPHLIPCGNGTDALQVALSRPLIMSLPQRWWRCWA